MENYYGRAISANYYRGIEAVGGILIFDATGITFRAHALNIQTGESRIEYRDILRAEARGFLTGMSVYTKDGVRHKFVVFHRKSVIEFLNSKVI